MIKAEQIPTEVLAVFEKACDSGEPWNIADTIAAAINAWPGVEPHKVLTVRDNGEGYDLKQIGIILPLPMEKNNV